MIFDNPEFLAKLAKVPEWVLLMPGTKLNRIGDEYMDVGETEFISCQHMDTDEACDYADNACLFRRPIPQELRMKIAKRMYIMQKIHVTLPDNPFELWLEQWL